MTVKASTSVNVSSSGQACPCDQYYDSVLGRCAPLTPNSISLPPAVQKYPFWLLHWVCDSQCGCAGYEGEGLAACNFGTLEGCNDSECGNPTFEFTISGQVLSGNTPVCNQPLKFTDSLPSSGTLTWQTSDRLFTGSFSIGAGVPAASDENGNFTVTYNMNIGVVSGSESACNPLAPSPEESSSKAIFSWVLKVALANSPSIYSEVTIQVETTFCESIRPVF